MSQAKVDRYKEEKKNRKQTIKKEEKKPDEALTLIYQNLEDRNEICYGNQGKYT